MTDAAEQSELMVIAGRLRLVPIDIAGEIKLLRALNERFANALATRPALVTQDGTVIVTAGGEHD